MPLQSTVMEQTTGLYSFLLVDADGIGLPSAEIEALTLTYYDVATGIILNDREEQDVLNTNDVVLATEVGPPPVTTVTWTLQVDDTPIVDDAWAIEPHAVLFRWTWDTGRRHGAYEDVFGVVNLGRPKPVPALLVTQREHVYGPSVRSTLDRGSDSRAVLRRAR